LVNKFNQFKICTLFIHIKQGAFFITLPSSQNVHYTFYYMVKLHQYQELISLLVCKYNLSYVSLAMLPIFLHFDPSLPYSNEQFGLIPDYALAYLLQLEITSK